MTDGELRCFSAADRENARVLDVSSATRVRVRANDVPTPSSQGFTVNIRWYELIATVAGREPVVLTALPTDFILSLLMYIAQCLRKVFPKASAKKEIPIKRVGVATPTPTEMPSDDEDGAGMQTATGKPGQCVNELVCKALGARRS